MPSVRLHREYKGPLADDHELEPWVARLPAQLTTVLRCLEQGDLAAADQALGRPPASVLAGPGHRRRRWRWLPLLLLLGALAAFGGAGFVLLGTG